MTADADDLRKLAIRTVEIMADGDLADFEAVIHPDAVNREAKAEPAAARGRGPAAAYASALWLRSAFSEMRWEVHEALVEGDVVALHTTMHARQIGTFVAYDADAKPDQAFPSTGKTFAVTQSHWVRIADGKLIEHWANRDDLGQAVQLGWVPPTPVYLLRMRRALGDARKAAQ
ncbi:ester cyclase [Nocardia sp. NPDC059240]|uniref:ester cyclase n=1 Tax=Nocardia sp. NPDC059240 TaxID=3346786 RepID=UPI0036794F77